MLVFKGKYVLLIVPVFGLLQVVVWFECLRALIRRSDKDVTARCQPCCRKTLAVYLRTFGSGVEKSCRLPEDVSARSVDEPALELKHRLSAPQGK